MKIKFDDTIDKLEITLETKDEKGEFMRGITMGHDGILGHTCYDEMGEELLRYLEAILLRDSKYCREVYNAWWDEKLSKTTAIEMAKEAQNDLKN